MRIHLTAACALGCALTLPALAFAQDDAKRPGRQPGALFERLDANKDGAVTKDEVPEERQRLFNRLIDTADKDKDGKLAREEFVSGLQDAEPNRQEREGRPRPDGGGPDQRPGPQMMVGVAIFRALDGDGDGKLSSREIENSAAALKKLDKNGDGELAREEMAQVPAGGLAGGRGFGAGGGPAGMLERLREMDKNNDGKWGKDELPPRLSDRFDALDGNKDGAVDRDELREAVGRFGPRGGEPGGKSRPAGRGRPDGKGRETEKKRTE